jgi:hypothetical protein
MSKVSDARQNFKPNKIKILFIAEAPPKESSNRFFYYLDVKEGDSLFIETMKVLYRKDFTNTKMVRLQKKMFLEKFKNDGYFLIDSTDNPMEQKSQSYKKRKIREALPTLKIKIRELIDSETRILLISKPVYDVCFIPLRSDGFNIINTEMIDFPGSGGQKNYKTKIEKIIPTSI